MAESNQDHSRTQEATAVVDGKGAAKGMRSPAVLFSGLAVSLIGVGAMLAVMAVPKKSNTHQLNLKGPFVARLSDSELQVNLAGESSKRYLVMLLNGEFTAYEEAYVNALLGSGDGETVKADPLYVVQLKNALLGLASTKTREQVTDPVQIEAFLEDARRLVEPVLFPVYIGDALSPHAGDSKSGLKLCESIRDSTFRGLLHEHSVQVDQSKGTLRFDAGPVVRFEDNQREVELANEKGELVWIDASELKSGFAAEVPIGVPGRLRRIYRESFLVQ